MRILVMAGHTASGNTGSGAVGHINESNETRKVGPKVVEYLKKLAVDAAYIQLDRATSSSYLYDQVKLANKGKFDCVVQIHFNAGSSDPNSKTTGTETYYCSSKGKVFSDRVNAKLGTVFTNRGSKDTKPNLYWLKNTTSPAILVEICFVDDKDDVRMYKDNFDKICKLIAEGIANKTYTVPSTSINVFYRVIAGSYTNKANAEVTVNQLKSNGYSAFIATFTKDNTLYYRAVAGSYSVRANADAQINKLKSDGYSAFIEVYNK